MTRTLAFATLLLTCCAPSGDPPQLELSDAWARPTVAGQSATAAYISIANSGGTDDILTSASITAPARASLHTTTYTNGVARMRPLADGLEIPAGETVELRPGGPHIMVEQLTAPLASGERLAVTLRFQRSGERSITIPVVDAAATGPAHQEH